ncbi:glycyl-tRNA synthetase subunit beta [Brevundimonas sp. AAP58]|uniref:glycine--tRNA ligase subunit beta n=1 Tax=Brevundimonas sp. AAP58 TaxID=1523422 RepID=UPI0006B98BC1|nr:glycine--tRNA ligase subunit beta [Brevundimonas sp. AAP58]KPF78656.1 glycyl-tRNA synthetase subunit beta [Brevundimonas sp. AAP58]
MPQLLLELFSEEIPARMQAQAARDLERMAGERLKATGLTYEALTTFAGPRRLTLVVEGLPAATPDRSEELKGPKVSAPEQALEGFLRKTGLTREQLTERDGVLYAVIEQKGRSTADLIPEMVEGIIRGFPWPKSMRWETGSLTWVRPLKRILCLFDGAVVPFAVEGIQSDDLTEGHRFMGSGHPLKVRSFEDYRTQLEANFVLLDQADRKLRIVEGARAVCQAQNLQMIDDDGLLEEVSGLAEWPTPILGDMDPSFLDLPPEVIRLSMKTHQKYFAVRDPATGGLAPNFVVVANVEATDGGKALAAGNSRVLSARLNDARFFWDEDRKVGFDAWLKKLEGVTFHAKLGTMAERVERIAALAREIAPLVGADPDQAEQAARLAKADLASGMVGEFPELQGVMGGYYARALLPSPFPSRGKGRGWGGGTEWPVTPEDSVGVSSPPDEDRASTPTQPRRTGFADPSSTPLEGEGSALADAIRDHYKPQGPGDTVPTAPLTVAVALADKLDTLACFYAIDERPTGSKDPFALRRAALGAIRLIVENGHRVPLAQTLIVCAFYAVSAASRIAMRDAQASMARTLAAAENDKFPSLLKFASDLINKAHTKVGGEQHDNEIDVDGEVLAFFADRLKVLLRDQGKRHDLVDAVFALGDDDLVRIVRRVEALDAFLATDDGANLLAGYKRASNILKAEEKKGPLPEGAVGTGLPNQPEAETTLAFAVERARGAVDQALATEDFAAAMTALAGLRAPVDDFFTDVMVNSDVLEERENRLKLLGQVRAVMGRVADFGQVAG